MNPIFLTLQTAPAAAPSTSLGQTNAIAIVFFFIFISITLGITYWAARRTRTAEQFYAAGRSITGRQNGLALAGDYMSAASFLGIAGLVSKSGFDGLIYSVGWLVGWPLVMFLIAEPLRNLGKYTFADVVAYRLKQKPVRIAAAIGTLVVITFYLIAQMVGAGSLIHLMFNGISYQTAVVVVGIVMLAYVLFGGMVATTWVQIVKAVLLLGGATILAIMTLAHFGFNPLALFNAAAEKYGAATVYAPGSTVANPWDAISLGMALMLGTAGLPHILMRFYTVPDAKQARISVLYATGFIGYFYLLTFILGFGASVLVGRDLIVQVNAGGNMAAPLLAEAVGGSAFLGFIAAVAFATILAVVAGLTLSGASAFSHDLYVNVFKNGQSNETEELRVARVTTVGIGIVAILLGILFEKQNVAYMVALAFAIAASTNLPSLILSIAWRKFTTNGAVASMIVGVISTLLLIWLSPTIQVDTLQAGLVKAIAAAKAAGDTAQVEALSAQLNQAWFPLKNPAIITIPLSFLVGIAVSLMAPERDAERKFLEVERKVNLGASD